MALYDKVDLFVNGGKEGLTKFLELVLTFDEDEDSDDDCVKDPLFASRYQPEDVVVGSCQRLSLLELASMIIDEGGREVDVGRDEISF